MSPEFLETMLVSGNCFLYNDKELSFYIFITGDKAYATLLQRNDNLVTSTILISTCGESELPFFSSTIEKFYDAEFVLTMLTAMKHHLSIHTYV